MRIELNKQICSNKELKESNQERDQKEYMTQIDFRDRKTSEEAQRRATFKANFIKPNDYDQLAQIQTRTKLREDLERKQRNSDFQERMKLEDIARQFHLEESQKKQRMKAKMQSLTEEDRQQRRDWFEKHQKPDAPSEASNNMINKRGQHDRDK